MSTRRQWPINKGPGELDFHLGLARQIPVEFTIDGHRIMVKISQIGIEDGSCKSWLFHGQIVGKYSPIPELPVGRFIEGWFDYRGHREGYVAERQMVVISDKRG